MTDTDADARAKLRALIADSSLPLDTFARVVLGGRDRRTLYRWLAGQPMGKAAVAWLNAVEGITRHDNGTVTVTVRAGLPIPKDVAT
jgi:hypothetical protein